MEQKDNRYKLQCIDATRTEENLTAGKIYFGRPSSDGEHFGVKNNRGSFEWYLATRFVVVSRVSYTIGF
jgi:hypothetical protein